MSPANALRPRLRALVLGSAAGGGVPQWNCGCRVCRLAWNGDKRVKPRTQAGLALSLDGASWLLLNASIDLRQQIQSLEQALLPGVLELYLERIERDPKGLFKLYPFVMQPKPGEPKLILINPAVGFGKPVIAGTGISTAVVASRFNARESIGDLASEYGVEPRQIEEAIRWERSAAVAA